jgi:predicted AAA+ superfamily ATPase
LADRLLRARRIVWFVDGVLYDSWRALLRAIKAAVDRNPIPGQFVLTGSSNFLTVPTISESLAGRAGFVEVWLFSQGELAGRADRFIDNVFDEPGAIMGYRPSGGDRSDLLERLCRGGYPEIHRLPARQRPGWFRDYGRTTIERDVVELSGIRKVAEMNQLLRLFAARSGCELVMQSIINDSPLERQAVYDHSEIVGTVRTWLETIHLVTTPPAWSRNLTRRVKRRPKEFLTDPGLAAWLLGKTPAALEGPTDPAIGQLVETFVFAELRRQLTWRSTAVTMFHWQDRAGAEVDLVVEGADGRVFGIEVKAGQTPPNLNGFAGLHACATPSARRSWLVSYFTRATRSSPLATVSWLGRSPPCGNSDLVGTWSVRAT